MRSRTLLVGAASAAVVVALVAPPGQAAPATPATPARPHAVVLVDRLNAPATRTFDAADVFSFWPLGRPQAMGPQFRVTRRVTLTEVGAFVNASADNYAGSTAAPYTVEIRRADADGRPSLGAPVAVRTMSDDRDADVWRYESAHFRLRLRPGTYFAMVTARAPATFANTRTGGVMGAWGLDDQGDYLYQPGEGVVGFLDHVAQTSQVFPVHQGPFRVRAVPGWHH